MKDIKSGFKNPDESDEENSDEESEHDKSSQSEKSKGSNNSKKLISTKVKNNDQLLENEIYQAPDSTASTTYKLLIMQKIFGGMRDRCRQKFGTMIYGENINFWLFNDIAKSIDKKRIR